MAKVKPDSRSTLLVELCLPALGDTTRIVLGNVVAELQRIDPTLDQDSLQIVLGEVLNNIIEHGYRRDPLGAVVVRVALVDHAITIDTWDWGKSYPEGEIPQGIKPDPSSLAEGGFGWFLIKSLICDMDYRRAHECNHLHLCLQV